MKITKVGRVGFLLMFVCLVMLVVELYVESLNNNFYNVPIFIMSSVGVILLFVETYAFL